jgi:UDP-N-acetylmuramoylalanine--D-glutamate ligase
MSTPLSFDNSAFTEPPFSSLSDIAGLKVTVMGLGLNGGGLATARFFASHGAEVTITDRKTEKELEPSIRALSCFPGIRYVLGAHELADFIQADTVIKNPGVKMEGNEYLLKAKSIETDISVFLRFTKAPILAVTGSKGKSSTVSALYFGLTELGYPAFLGGNITVSPLTFLDRTDEGTPVVLELSSWQLADLRGRGLLKPAVAILTPVMADHQNWYGSMEPYVADKKLIYADQEADGFLICNHDDQWGKIFASEARSRVSWYSGKKLPENMNGAWLEEDGRGFMRTDRSGRTETFQILPARLAVPGTHMRQNLLNAAQALVLFGSDPQKTSSALARFPGIEHRLELFHSENGIRYYNDSAATIPEAVVAALDSFTEPVILLTGGTDKNLDFTPLADAAHMAKKILLLAGTGTDKLIPLLRERNIPFEGPFTAVIDLVNAVRADVLPGDAVVFSPGATSFGMFLNEFDRGNKFREAVLAKQILN